VIFDRLASDYETGYRSVRLRYPENDESRSEWFAGCHFRLQQGVQAESRERIKQLLAQRMASQPLEQPNAGSVFRNPPGDYAASCRGRELAYEKVSREEGAHAVLIRLNYSVEFRYGVLVDIAQRVLAELPVDVSTGRVNAIWQRDAVDHIIRSSAVAASPAVPLNVTGAPALSVRSVAGEFGRLLGREAVITGREEETAWLANPGRSHAIFGTPEVKAQQMIEWIAAWLLAGGCTHGKPTKFENREGKF